LVLNLGLDTAANTAIFRNLVGSRLLEALKLGDAALARAELAAHLPLDLTPHVLDQLETQLDTMITEILHGPA
jgi:hypothetical protein